MADEWRVRVSLPPRSRPAEDASWAAAVSALRSRISDDVKVSEAPAGIFLYAGSSDASVLAARVVREVLAEHHFPADVRCDRWNRVSRAWTSHEGLMKAERKQSAATGRASWLVRAGPSCPWVLVALARRLKADGFIVARQWRYLFAGANCEDDAHALAGHIRASSSVAAPIAIQRVYDRPRPVRVAVVRGACLWVEARGEWHSA